MDNKLKEKEIEYLINGNRIIDGYWDNCVLNVEKKEDKNEQK